MLTIADERCGENQDAAEVTGPNGWAIVTWFYIKRVDVANCINSRYFVTVVVGTILTGILDAKKSVKCSTGLELDRPPRISILGLSAPLNYLYLFSC